MRARRRVDRAMSRVPTPRAMSRDRSGSARRGARADRRERATTRDALGRREFVRNRPTATVCAARESGWRRTRDAGRRGTGRARTDLLPVLALVVRDRAAEDVVLIVEGAEGGMIASASRTTVSDRAPRGGNNPRSTRASAGKWRAFEASPQRRKTARVAPREPPRRARAVRNRSRAR